MQIRSQENFWSGVMFLAIGVGFAAMSTRYQMGTAARMGPGYFPFWLGVVLALLGAAITMGALSPKAQPTVIARFDWRVAGLIVGAVVLYGILMQPLGVYIATFILVVSSSIAGHDFSWKVALANGAALVVFVYAAFVKGLGLIFPLWPTFLGAN